MLTSQPTKRFPTSKVTSRPEPPAPARAGAGQRRRDTRGTVGDQQGQEGFPSPTQRPVGPKRWRPADIHRWRTTSVHPGHRSLLPAAPTACHGPVGTPAGYGSGEWHPRRSRCRPGCVDAFAAAQGLRDAGLSSLIVLDVYSPIAEVPSPNQAHDLISSDAQKVQRPTADAMPASSPFTIDLPHHLGTRGHCSGCRA